MTTYADLPTDIPEHEHPAEPSVDIREHAHGSIAAAEAEAIRAQTEAAKAKAAAEIEAAKAKAAAEVEAIRLKAEADRQRAELAAAKAAAKAAAEIAAAEAEAERVKAAAEAERQEREAQLQAEAEKAERREKSAQSWRKAAIAFAIVCGVVALPVQASAFWNPHAPWLLAAPLFLEGGAWVVLRGAAAAVDDHAPHWHYRLIAWVLAAIAATINLAHGLSAFDPATAGATAFASLAGPGVWDLYEHGRIRKRDGKLSRRERRAKERAEAAERAAQEAAEAAAREAAEKLAKEQEERHPDVWKRALDLAAALNESTVTAAVWKRAWDDVHGTALGDTAETIAARVAAKARAKAAAATAEGEKPQVESQTRTPRKPGPQGADGRKKNGGTPPVRRPGDGPKYTPGVARFSARTRRATRAPKGLTASE